jgi:hypothetical protein
VPAIHPDDAAKLDACERDFGRRLAAALLTSPHRIAIGNTYRSRDEQQRLYDGYKAGKPGFNPANPPGVGKHDLLDDDGNPAAEAADLRSGPGRDWLRHNAGSFGLVFPYDHEPWHVESDGRPRPITPDEELDMTKDELRAIVRTEVNAAVALVLRGSKTHPDHLKQLRADVAALSAKVDKLHQ